MCQNRIQILVYNKSKADGKAMIMNTMETDKLVLPPVMTLQQVVLLHDEYCKKQYSNNISIDASQVKEVDMAGMQLIAFYCQTLRENHVLNFNPPPSDYFKQQAILSGLAQILQIKGENA